MRDRLEGVSVFVEAVKAGGFSRAAERLALSRSAVGKIIARLETRLGVRLFHRTTRVQTLTEDGLAYYERCQRALEELRAGENLLESGRHEVAGSLRVTMPVLYGRHCIAPILMSLAKEHPKFELDLRFSDLVTDVIGEGYDLAIRNGVTQSGSGLRTRRLLSQRKILCAAPSYLAEKGRPSGIADIEAHDALVYCRNGQIFPWQVQDDDGKLCECPLRWRWRLDDLESIMSAALAGMGIAFLPDWLVREHVAAGRLVRLLGEQQSAPIDTYAVWPESQHMPKKIRLAIDALVDRLPSMTAAPDDNNLAA